jgi:nucleoside-diphosphate-sugar epimerase
MINSNITFGLLVLKAIQKKIKLFINFGSMMEYNKFNIKQPLNFYGLTKKIYEQILNFLINKNKIRYYNIKLYDSFGYNDNRNKIIPKMLSNYSKNEITIINSENLKLNIISIEKILEFIEYILLNKTKTGSYCLLGNFTNIKKLIESINKKLIKKILVEYENKKTISQVQKKIKNLKYAYFNEDISEYIFKIIKE